MPIQTCPTDIIQASAERAWDLLTIPSELGKWSGTRVVERRERSLRVGARWVLGAGLGRRLKVFFDIREAVSPWRLALDSRLPLGITNHEIVLIAPVSPDTCRVTFN